MRVVIAEDEALLRQGLALVLEQDGFEVVSAVGTAAELEDVFGVRLIPLEGHRQDDGRLPDAGGRALCTCAAGAALAIHGHGRRRQERPSIYL